jgi:hypothetical protein
LIFFFLARLSGKVVSCFWQSSHAFRYPIENNRLIAQKERRRKKKKEKEFRDLKRKVPFVAGGHY